MIIDEQYSLQSSEAKMIANAASNTRALSRKNCQTTCGSQFRSEDRHGVAPWHRSAFALFVGREQIQRPAFCNGR